MTDNACKAENLSGSFLYFVPTKFITSSFIAPSARLCATVCNGREVFGKSGKEVRVEIEKQFSERDLFYLTERTEVKK
jgi:hypothetical protein